MQVIILAESFTMAGDMGRYLANLQIGVKPQNEKSWIIFSRSKKGMTDQAGQRRIFANRVNKADIFQLSDGVRLGVQSRQVRFYPGIVDA